LIDVVYSEMEICGIKFFMSGSKSYRERLVYMVISVYYMQCQEGCLDQVFFIRRFFCNMFIDLKATLVEFKQLIIQQLFSVL